MKERKRIGSRWLDRCPCGHWKTEASPQCKHCRQKAASAKAILKRTP